jgi:LPXTG-motif cell wall-anchored protein
MNQVVDCINKGRNCGAGTPPENGNGSGKGDDGGGKGDNGGKGNGESGDKGGKDNNDGKGDEGGDGKGDTGNGGATEAPAKGGTPNGQDDAAGSGGSGDEAVKSGGTAGADAPRTESTVASDAQRAQAGATPGTSASPSAVSRPEGGEDQEAAGSVNPAPQAEGSRGSLAETGSQLWPAAAGALMLCAGLVVLLRSRRHTARR